MGAAGGAAAGASIGLVGGPVGAGAIIGGGLGAANAYIMQEAASDNSQIYYGTDPAHEDFGARRIKVADGPPPDYPDIPAHSSYFDPELDPGAARNIALIVAGQGHKTTTQEHR
ncbi:hypothetical protein AB0A69_08430 [Streptomyces sp. NPDC045431]|uniref:hypothetical protein n=1 Tax=Streptomyces sp. NPDC045431 TaxID=3155613 RepID=UPI0034082185